jgi:hypothetical protein
MPRILLAPFVALLACTTRAPQQPAPIPLPASPPPTVSTTPPPNDPPPTAPTPPEEPAPAGPATVKVTFKIDPVIGPNPPTLHITVRHDAAHPVAMTRFDDPHCFAHHYLDLRISRPDGKPQPLTPCVAKAWPGVDAPLAPGEQRRVDIPLTALAASWPPGTYKIDVSWEPNNLAAARGAAAATRADQSSLNATDFTISKPRASFRITRGQTKSLPDGVLLKFTGNSHKNVMAGDTSPLIIYGTITRPGGKEQEFSFNLQVELTRIFRLDDDLVFELTEYAYGDWLDLHYYGKVPVPR